MCSGNSKRTKQARSSERREAWRDDLLLSGIDRGCAPGCRETPCKSLMGETNQDASSTAAPAALAGKAVATRRAVVS